LDGTSAHILPRAGVPIQIFDFLILGNMGWLILQHYVIILFFYFCHSAEPLRGNWLPKTFFPALSIGSI